MALATKCPHCNTIFRVAADQLKLCGGIVRCGSCTKVFDGNAALLDISVAPPAAPWPVTGLQASDPTPEAALDIDLGASLVVDEVPADPVAASAFATPPMDDNALPAEVEPVFTLDFDSSFDPFGTLPDAPLPNTITPPAEATPPAAVQTPLEADTLAAPPLQPYTELDYDLDQDLSYADITPLLAGPAPAQDTESEGAQTIAPVVEPETPVEAAVELTEPPPVAAMAEPEQAAPAPLKHAVEPELELGLEPEPESEPELEAGAPVTAAVPEEPAAPAEPEAVAPVDALAQAAAVADEQAPAAMPAEAVDEHLVASAIIDDQPLDTGTASVARLIKKRTSGRSRTDQLATPAEPVLFVPAAAPEPEPEPVAAAEAASVEPAEAEADLPGFVKQARRRERMGRTVRLLMGGAVVVLLGTLALQGMTTYRNRLAADVPALKPALVGACAKLGCQVNLPAQIDMLSVEQGELQSLSDTTFSYATVLRNQSGSAQAWPDIELTLNDGNDRPVLRRVLAPRDYLAPASNVALGFGPRSEQAVRLNFSLAELKAAGYHIAIFYP